MLNQWTNESASKWTTYGLSPNWMTSQNLDICLFLVYKKSVWIQSWWLWCGAGSQGTTRCFDSPPQGSHSTILNAMTHDFVPDALDRCTLGDLCLRHLPGPQEQISTVFFSSQLKANGRQQFLYFGNQYKWNLQRCKHSWQGAFFSNQMPALRKSLIGYYIDLLFLYRVLCAGWTFSHGRCSQILFRVILLGMPMFA